MSVIGFIGPGLLGGAIIERLIERGVRPLIWARNSERIAPLLELGAVQAESVADLARRADIVIGALKDDAVVSAMYRGSEGILARARPGTILVEHATVSPGLVRALAEEARERNLHLLDAPVSGGPQGARAGTLAIMAGGDSEILDRVRPVLAHYAGTLTHVGPSGSGQSLKLINQLLVAVHAVAATEAAALIERSGIDPVAARATLAAGWAGSVQLDRVLERAVSRDFRPDGAPVGGMVEVLRLVGERARETGVRSHLLEPTQKVFAHVSENHATDAFSALITAALPADSEG